MEVFTYEDYLKIEQNPKTKEFLEETDRSYMETYEKLKSETDKKHDVIFKRILLNKKEVSKFIYKKFKIKIKAEELELYNKEFIKRGGRLLSADVIYKLKNRKVFFLIEHQTKNYYHMSFRILNYEVEIMRTCSGSKKEEKEAVVLAGVIHTGKDKWTAPRTIRELQEDIYGKGLKLPVDLQTLGNYALEDVNDYTKEELLESESLVDKAMYLEKMKTEEEFIEGAKEVYKRIEEEEKEYMDEVIRIALSGILDVEEIEVLIRELNKGDGKGMLAVKEVLERDLKKRMTDSFLKGEKYGKENGILEGRLEDAKNMLEKNMDIDLIEEITGLKREEFM